MSELRCDGTMHGRLVDPTHLEVKCVRRKCGYKPGVVVLHVFDITTGEFETHKFADPIQKGQVNHGSVEPGVAVRSA